MTTKPYIPKRSEVRFQSSLTWAQTPQCSKSRKRFRDKKNFLSYRDTFEQCFVKVELLAGRIGTIEECPILPPANQSKKLELPLGRNWWAEERVKYGPELFAWYRKGGDFWSNVKRTRYWGSLAKRGAPPAVIRSKINKCIKIYNRSKRYGTFGPQKSYWTSADLPQLIDYHGYLKNMDGAHRRMVAYGMGLKTIPCLVVRFKDLTKHDFKSTLPFLRDNWEWFKNIVEGYADGVQGDRAGSA